MAIEIFQFPCLQDNYGFIFRDEATKQTACIDTPDADAVLAALKECGWQLDHILNTHWHPDHVGGNEQIRAETGCTITGPAEAAEKTPIDRVVNGGDRVMVGDTTFNVIEVGGHTLGHIAYHSPEASVAFVGDVLFPLGCGRIFEGTPDQMFTSLNKLRSLPAETRIYCAHEYSAANARFALSVDTSPELRKRADEIFEARSRGEWTVPTTVRQERQTNPFLRPELLAAAVGTTGAPAVESFAALRRAKDNFKG